MLIHNRGDIQSRNLMSSADPRVSQCRRCQHYQLQGRRGGHCNKLNVGVQGNWGACSLATPVFASSLDLSPLDLTHLLADSRLQESERLQEVAIEVAELYPVDQAISVDR
jgi:hypothetical protein